MFRARLSALVLLCVGLSGPAVAEDRSFDVPGGEVRAIYRLDLAPNTALGCRLRLSHTNPNENWASSISIILSETEDVLSTSDESRFVQLGLGLDNGHRRYNLTIRLGQESHSYAFFGAADKISETNFSLGFRDDGTFGYRAREDEDTFAQGYELEPRVQPRYAVVVASGLAGTVNCGSVDL